MMLHRCRPVGECTLHNNKRKCTKQSTKNKKNKKNKTHSNYHCLCLFCPCACAPRLCVCVCSWGLCVHVIYTYINFIIHMKKYTHAASATPTLVIFFLFSLLLNSLRAICVVLTSLSFISFNEFVFLFIRYGTQC